MGSDIHQKTKEKTKPQVHSNNVFNQKTLFPHSKASNNPKEKH
jgi:hypothetical protein